jgi:quercetin dioxygenase-like cupin family protein
MSRRVVTGLDEAGKSCFTADGAIPSLTKTISVAWNTAGVPVDNTAELAPATVDPFELMHAGGTTFMLVRVAAGSSYQFHATDTIDYITMLAGRMVLVTESGETTLQAGDLCVDRGIVHGWRNDGPEEALYSAVIIPAHPVGAGRTV